MKRTILTILLWSLNGVVCLAGDVIGSVLDNANGCKVPGVILTFLGQEDSYTFITDDSGDFRFSIPDGKYKVTVSCDGYHTNVMTDDVEVGGTGVHLMRFRIEPDFHELGDVVVTGQRRLTRFHQGGLSYELSKDERAQGKNLLSALDLVPLVSTSDKGEVKVKGESGCAIYLNGRPYTLAMADPAAVLSSINSEKVKSVEVETEPSSRYGLSAGTTLINIVTDNSALDGIYSTTRLSGSTEPNASGKELLMGMRGNVRMSLAYDYDFSGQYDQRIEGHTEYVSGDLTGASSRSFSDKGNEGKWQWHTGRAILEWSVDSIRTLYADAHLKIERTDFRQMLGQSLTYPGQEPAGDSWSVESRNRATSGSVEANASFTEYFRHVRGVRYMLGYRFTHNPDRRNLLTSTIHDGTRRDARFSTRGGLNQHTIRYFHQANPAEAQYIVWGASVRFSKGNTTTEDNPSEDMRYRQDIYTLNLTYAGSLSRRFRITASVRGELCRFRIHGDDAASTASLVPFSKSYLSVLPYFLAEWYPRRQMHCTLYFQSKVRRPSVTMLNPFSEILNPLTSWHGNPDLREERIHSAGITANMYSQKYYVSLTLTGSLRKDALSPYYYSREGTARETGSYTNISSVRNLGAQYYLSLSPTGWLSMSLNGQFSRLWMRDSDLGLRQKDWEYHLNADATFILPKSWTIVARYGRHKGAADPFCTNSPFDMYSLRADKSLLGGALTLGAYADNVFGKYNRSVSTIQTATSRSLTMHDIKMRGFGISVSYTFFKGKDVKVERQQWMSTDDIDTGVR